MTVFLLLACSAKPQGPDSSASVNDSSPPVETGDSPNDSGADGGPGDSGASDDMDHDGWTAADGDCDDEDSVRNPGAEEVPMNGRDENCDASDAGPVVQLRLAPTVLGVEAQAHAGFGVSAASESDGGELLVGATGEPGFSASKGAAYGVSVGCDAGIQPVGDANWSIQGVESQGALGREFQVGTFGPESTIMVAADRASGGRGFVYGIAQGATGTIMANETPTQVQGGKVVGLGTAIDSLGDTDGDGWDELVVGAFPVDDRLLGAVHIMAGPLAGSVPYDEVTTASIYGAKPLDEVGESVAAVGDQTGDGLADLLIGATEGLADGKAYLMAGPFSGSHDVFDAVATIEVGDRGVTTLGYDVANTGDLDGDGRDDLAVSAALDSVNFERGGSVYFFVDPLEGTIELTDATAYFEAETAFEWLGYRMERAGDFDGDGDPEVALAAPRDYYFGGDYPGKVYLLGGPFNGEMTLENVRSVLVGEHPGDFAGGALATVGDLNADGRAELAVGAPHNDTLNPDAGAAYLLCTE